MIKIQHFSAMLKTNIGKRVTHEYFPGNKEALKEIIKKLISDEIEGKTDVEIKNMAIDLNSIETSEINDMSELFKELKYNIDISEWDVSNVIDMSYVFTSCTHFNSDISQWDISHVINMIKIFYNCKSYHGDLYSFDLSSLRNYRDIFYGCPKK